MHCYERGRFLCEKGGYTSSRYCRPLRAAGAAGSSTRRIHQGHHPLPRLPMLPVGSAAGAERVGLETAGGGLCARMYSPIIVAI